MIEIKKCSKSFGAVKAVDKVSLEIGEREVFGLVGSNGAGKSTLLRMAAGILKPDEGEIEIDGESIYDNEKAKACIFYIPDDSYFPADYTPRDIACLLYTSGNQRASYAGSWKYGGLCFLETDAPVSYYDALCGASS